MSLMLGRNPAYYAEFCCAECRGDLSYAKCHIFFAILGIVMLSFAATYLRPKKLYTLVPGMQLHN
jgi:hypothetical protein